MTLFLACLNGVHQLLRTDLVAPLVLKPGQQVIQPPALPNSVRHQLPALEVLWQLRQVLLPQGQGFIKRSLELKS